MGVFNYLSSFLLLWLLVQTPAHAQKKTYVVYLGAHSHGHDATAADLHRVTDHHHQFLESFLGSKKKAQDAIIYSFTKHINGFAVKLEVEDASAISKHPDVMSVFSSRGAKLHTTRSWEFMALERDGVVPRESPWAKANFGEDVIIATLDTGLLLACIVARQV